MSIFIIFITSRRSPPPSLVSTFHRHEFHHCRRMVPRRRARRPRGGRLWLQLRLLPDLPSCGAGPRCCRRQGLNSGPDALFLGLPDYGSPQPRSWPTHGHRPREHLRRYRAASVVHQRRVGGPIVDLEVIVPRGGLQNLRSRGNAGWLPASSKRSITINFFLYFFANILRFFFLYYSILSGR